MNRLQIRYILLAVTALGLLVRGAALTIPHTFTDGDVIGASEMDANFTAVKNAVESRLTDGGLAGVTLLYGREAIDLATLEPENRHVTMRFGARGGLVPGADPELHLGLIAGGNLPASGTVYVAWSALHPAALTALSTQDSGLHFPGDA